MSAYPHSDQRLRVVVLSDLAPRPDFALSVRTAPAPIRLEPGGFDAFISSSGPAFIVPVANALGTGQSVDIQVRWNRWADLNPARIVEHNPTLRCLGEIRRAMRAGLAGHDLVGLIHRALGPLGQSLTASTFEADRDGEMRIRTHVHEPVAIPSSHMSLLDLVAMPDLRESGKSSVQREELLGLRLEEGFREMLDATLVHPEYRRLERRWRGLKLLADQVRDNRDVELYVVSVDNDEVTEVLAGIAELEPDVVVIDAILEANSRSLAWCRKWSDIASDLQAPLVTEVDASWIGLSLQSALATARDYRNQQSPACLMLSTLAKHANSRWLTFAFNGVLHRGPHEIPHARFGIEFRQTSDSADAFCAVNPAIIVIALALRSQCENGHPFWFTGDQRGVFRNLAARTVQEGDHFLAIAVQTPLSPSIQSDLAGCGIAAFGHVANRDFATLLYAPTVKRRSQLGGGLGGPESTLADQILVGRLARAFTRTLAEMSSKDDPETICATLSSRLLAVFAHQTAMGPQVDVSYDSNKGLYFAQIRPGQYAALTIEELELCQPLSACRT